MFICRLRMGQINQRRNLHKCASIFPIYLVAKCHYRCFYACTAFALGVDATRIVLTKDWPDNYIFDRKHVSVRLRMLL